ncbi:42442_t:CDS:2, partial [Gigaspora margarita]
ETTLGITITLHRRLAKTHKYEEIVGANALTKRKNLQENEHNEILEQNMAKWQKKNKNPQHCPLLEYLHNNGSLFWDKKNNSTITQSLEVTEITQKLPKNTNNLELMLDMALQLDQIEEQDTTRGSSEINT